MSNLDGKGTTITQFNAIDADITVKSSDDVLFRLHCTNIEVQAGEFRPIDQQQLPEPAHVLAIIFQFLYPQDHPKLTDTEFETVQAVATSAEKYKIFSAMHVSQVRLREFLPNHAKEILIYAIEFDYLDLVDETARLCSRSPVYDMLEGLPSQTWLPWALYHKAWETVFEAVITNLQLERSGGDRCIAESHRPVLTCMCCQRYLAALVNRLRTLSSLSEVESALTCGYIDSGVNRTGTPGWDDLCTTCPVECRRQPKIMKCCRDGIKAMREFPFSEFLKSNSPKEEVYTPAVKVVSEAVAADPADTSHNSGCCLIH